MVPTGTPNKGSVLRLQKKSRKIRLSRVNEDGTTETMVTHRSKSSHDISYSPSELPSAETNEIWLENATKPVEYYSKCLIVLTKFPYFQFFRYFSLLFSSLPPFSSSLAFSFPFIQSFLYFPYFPFSFLGSFFFSSPLFIFLSFKYFPPFHYFLSFFLPFLLSSSSCHYYCPCLQNLSFCFMEVNLNVELPFPFPSFLLLYRIPFPPCRYSSLPSLLLLFLFLPFLSPPGSLSPYPVSLPVLEKE